MKTTTSSMTDRQRFIATILYQPTDRLPFMPGHGRKSTRSRWHREGLPEGVEDVTGYVRQILGLEPETGAGHHVGHGVKMTMIPEFEEKIIEERPDSRVVQDWKGNICEIGREFDPSFLRGAPDFVTRSWIKCPVESRDDWADMARRYDTNDPSRFPADFEARIRKARDRDYVVGMVFPGPFWQLREWLGFENLCMLLLDDPDFAFEMIDFWKGFVSTMLEKTFRRGKGFIVDYVMINEDMAYKEKPMVGPEQSRKFLLPSWRQWGEICRGAGVPVYSVDSDGFVGSLIPVWIEAGFQYNAPQEVAAGNDLPAYSRQFGRKMAYGGGVDKRKIAAGGQALRDEMARLQPVADAGGYVPGCDHGVPSDVSWKNFVEYCRLLARMTRWL